MAESKPKTLHSSGRNFAGKCRRGRKGAPFESALNGAKERRVRLGIAARTEEVNAVAFRVSRANVPDAKVVS